jgi:hypothetical protein
VSLNFLQRLSIEPCLRLVLKLCGYVVEFPPTDPTPLHGDNTSAIQIAANLVYHERIKHIEVDCHYIREAFTQGVITLPHVNTNLQIADVFVAPDIAAALKNHRMRKKNRFLASCSFRENVLFKESPPSIMITRNPNWSTEILWYGTT